MTLSDNWEKMTQEEREDACSGNEDRIMVCPHCGYQNYFTEFVDPGNSDSGLAGCPVCCKDFEWVAETFVYFRTSKKNQQMEQKKRMTKQEQKQWEIDCLKYTKLKEQEQ